MITVQQIITTARRIALENPDFVYTPRNYADVHGLTADEVNALGDHDEDDTTCTYVGPRTEDCCLFGRALLELGLAQPDWDNPNYGDHRLNTLAIREVLDELEQRGEIDRGTVDQRLWANFVQQSQDQQIEWGETIDDADAKYPGIA